MAVFSSRIGEVRWSDVRGAVGEDDSVEVVVRSRHSAAVSASVKITSRWSGNGWARLLMCPRCEQPRQVLRLCGDRLLCNRCSNHRTQQSLHHRSKSWKTDGAQTDQLLKLVRSGKLEQARALGESLLESTLSRLEELERMLEG